VREKENETYRKKRACNQTKTKAKEKKKKERENWRVPERAMKLWTIPKKFIGDF
jgi:hypothetical protein